MCIGEKESAACFEIMRNTKNQPCVVAQNQRVE